MEIEGIEIGPGMTREQAEKLYALGRDVAVFVMMVLAKKLAAETAASTDAPATPSSAKPPYEKENRQTGKKGGSKRKKAPGAKPGHAGRHRDKPEQIDRREERRAEACPHCGNKRLRRRKKKRKRIIVDLPEGFRAVGSQ